MLMTSTSSWIALRNPTFGKLWVATVVSGICVAAHDTAAIWIVNSLSHSTMLLSLTSTAATLPFFLFILPAGALGDMTERKKMCYGGYIWLAGCAGGLAILGWLNLLTPSVILGSIFLIGTGFAEAPNSLAFSTSLTSKKRNTSFGFSMLRNKCYSFNPASLRAGKWASYADFHWEKFETLWRTRRWGMDV